MTTGTLTLSRSNYRKIVRNSEMLRLWYALVRYTTDRGIPTGWTADGIFTVRGPVDTIEKVRKFLDS